MDDLRPKLAVLLGKYPDRFYRCDMCRGEIYSYCPMCFGLGRVLSITNAVGLINDIQQSVAELVSAAKRVVDKFCDNDWTGRRDVSDAIDKLVI
jgi:hypothetical protein